MSTHGSIEVRPKKLPSDEHRAVLVQEFGQCAGLLPGDLPECVSRPFVLAGANRPLSSYEQLGFTSRYSSADELPEELTFSPNPR